MNPKVKAVLSAVAPTIATALGGPLAGAAVAELARRFTDGDAAAVEPFILGASPEVLLEIKKADQEFAIKLKELGVRLEELAHADRADARALARATSLRPQVTLSTVFLTGYFIVVGAFMGGIVAVPADFKETFGILIGVLTASVPAIMQFWFGSSTGSKHKDALFSGAP